MDHLAKGDRRQTAVSGYEKRDLMAQSKIFMLLSIFNLPFRSMLTYYVKTLNAKRG